jgi:hypothetical protein
MARRAHNKISWSRLWLVGITLLIVGTSSALLFQFYATPFRTTPLLNPADYFENSNSLRGNTYRLEGVIANSLGYSPEKGRLYSLQVTHGNSSLPVPILVPAGYQILNLQKGQKYQVKVMVNDQGLLQVEEITKA